MVTFLDLGLFQYFNLIFPILLIFAVIFALLHKTKLLGENSTINAVVAIAVALMSLLSQTVIDLVNYIAPWFVFVFIFVILLLLIYQTLGATEADVLDALKKEKTIQWAVFGVAIVILIAGFAHVLGGEVLAITQPGEIEAAEEPFEQKIGAILFNPQVLGLIFIFLIAVFAIAFLSGGS